MPLIIVAPTAASAATTPAPTTGASKAAPSTTAAGTVSLGRGFVVLDCPSARLANGADSRDPTAGLQKPPALGFAIRAIRRSANIHFVPRRWLRISFRGRRIQSRSRGKILRASHKKHDLLRRRRAA